MYLELMEDSEWYW